MVYDKDAFSQRNSAQEKADEHIYKYFQDSGIIFRIYCFHFVRVLVTSKHFSYRFSGNKRDEKNEGFSSIRIVNVFEAINPSPRVGINETPQISEFKSFSCLPPPPPKPHIINLIQVKK